MEIFHISLVSQHLLVRRLSIQVVMGVTTIKLFPPWDATVVLHCISACHIQQRT